MARSYDARPATSTLTRQETRSIPCLWELLPRSVAGLWCECKRKADGDSNGPQIIWTLTHRATVRYGLPELPEPPMGKSMMFISAGVLYTRGSSSRVALKHDTATLTCPETVMYPYTCILQWENCVVICVILTVRSHPLDQVVCFVQRADLALQACHSRNLTPALVAGVVER